MNFSALRLWPARALRRLWLRAFCARVERARRRVRVPEAAAAELL